MEKTEIERMVRELLGELTKEAKKESQEFLVEASGRHVHLSQEHITTGTIRCKRKN